MTRHPITGKRDRRGYNGVVTLSPDLYRRFKRHCEVRGRSMRATLDQAITASIDEMELGAVGSSGGAR